MGSLSRKRAKRYVQCTEGKNLHEGQLCLKLFFDLRNGIIITTTNERRPTFDIIKTAQR